MRLWQFWEIFIYEMRGLFCGRVPLACLLIGTPLGFTLIFGTIYGANIVNDIPLIIYDEDQSALSRKVIQAYADADRFVVAEYVQSEEEMRAALLDNHGKAALAIPRDFAKDVKQGRSAEALLIVNSANNMFGNATIAASQEIARNLEVSVSTSMLESGGLMPAAALANAYPVRLGVRITGDPANGYAAFMLGGLMLNGLQIGIMVTLAPLLITELLRRRYARRYPSWLFMLAGTAPYALVAFIGYIIAMLACIHLFYVPMHGSFLAACALGGAFIAFVCCVLLVFSACVPSRELSLQAPMLYIMPGLLYSGLSWPPFDMSTFATAFGALLPMTYAGDALRDIMLSGYAPDLMRNVSIMLAAAVGCFLVAWGIFHWRRLRGFRHAEEVAA